MTFNLKQSSAEKYPINIGGKVLELSSEQIGELIKKKLRKDLAVVKMFRKFDLDVDNQLNNLTDQIK